MKPLFINPTEETPKVQFDPQSGYFQIVGNSYPENSNKFFTPILEWLREFSNTMPNKALTVEFNFDYFNTSSAKYILEILRALQDHQQKGNECTVKWFYLEDDTDMLEAGEDYQASVSLPFEMVQREDDY